mmetsp:Transcript_13524/g.41781  ORF Transcript_13524/g.41781 Transcript_13524/m.41781 type:complete len:112 (-) Transcript_13524:185-520(-)
MGDWSSLNIASRNGHLETARLLLNSGAHVNDETDTGATPLFNACYDGYSAVVRLLLEHGAEIRSVLNTSPVALLGRTPQIIAQSNGHAALAAWLAKIGEGRATFRCPATSW